MSRPRLSRHGEVGATLDDLGAARLRYWHAQLEHLAPIEAQRDLDAIVPRCLEELAKPHGFDLARTDGTTTSCSVSTPPPLPAARSATAA